MGNDYAKGRKSDFLKNTWNIGEAVYPKNGNIRSVVKRLVERVKEEGEEGFKPRSKRPKNMPNKTPQGIEKKIIKLREETGYGAIRISRIEMEFAIRRKEKNIEQSKGIMILKRFTHCKILK